MVTELLNMSNLHIILLLITIGYYYNVDAFECRVTLNYTKGKIPLTGVYDLCDFVKDSESYPGYYAAYDNRTTGNIEDKSNQFSTPVNYTFYFNIAANVALQVPDKECDDYSDGMHEGYCNAISWEGKWNQTCKESDLVPIKTMVAAYQAKGETDDEEAKCWRLHDGVTPPIWTFLDESDPALGIQLLYVNGDYCAAYGKNREFKMKFKCANDIQLTPDLIEEIYEPIDEGCSYEFYMETFKGCPIECIVDNDQLCSGHGVCDYDWQLQKPKCFCYNGYYGPDCSAQSDPDIEIVYQDSDNSYVGALVVVILLLLVILFILGYLFLRYTRVKNQPFDFKFLQQTKAKRSKKGKKLGQDEYDDE